MNFRHSMAQVQRDVVVIETLFNISWQSRRIGLHLIDSFHMSPFQCQTPCHDHANVSGSQYHHLFSRHLVVQIDISLRHSRGEYSRRTLSGYGKSSSRSLTAAHGEYHRLRLISHKTTGSYNSHQTIARNTGHGSICNIRYPKLTDLRNKSTGIFRPAEGDSESCKSETIMYALTEYTSKVLFTFNYKDIPDTLLPQLHRSAQTGRPSAHDKNIYFFYFLAHTFSSYIFMGCF